MDFGAWGLDFDVCGMSVGAWSMGFDAWGMDLVLGAYILVPSA